MDSQSPQEPMLRCEGISKAFGANAVLRGVSFSLNKGEVLALVGENGAGKSTLMNILSGGLRFDSGAIHLEGRDYRPSGPVEAIRSGVAIAHQETALMPDLSVAENVFFGREPRNRLGLIRQRALHEQCRALFSDLGFPIDPSRMGFDLSAAERQLVEIVKAVQLDPKLLILDEPTASLSAQAADAVLGLMEKLKSRGISVIFISHRLPEVMAAADRVVVLKDGELTLEARRGAFERDDLIQAMVGRKLDRIFPERPAGLADAEIVFSVEAGANRDISTISLSVRRGEVLGIAGLEGQGQRPLAAALCGALPFTSGKIRVDGRPVKLGSVRAAIGAGVAAIPDDRKVDGLALDLPIRMNLSLFAISDKARAGILPLAAETAFAKAARQRFSIRSTDIEQPVGQLSGGNQQKVVFARWLAHQPRLLVLNEPTKGVDVGTKTELYQLVGELTTRGVAVIMISSDLIELIGLSDRILTLYEGKITGEIGRADFSEERIMRHAAGAAAEMRHA
jgi:ABC-type sugar transport system ATPase subunit